MYRYIFTCVHEDGTKEFWKASISLMIKRASLYEAEITVRGTTLDVK